MPRTTLAIEDDAMHMAKLYAARHGLTLGRAVSALVRKSVERRVATIERSGLRVVLLGPRSPKVTAALVDRLGNRP